MLRKKDEFVKKNIHDAKTTDNSFTQAVKKASSGGEKIKKKILEQDKDGTSITELKARDELMRAKEARNETTSESEQFRRDEN